MKKVFTAKRREGAQLLLRFPENSNLKDRLDEAARSSNRSLTAEIINRLEASLIDSPSPTKSESTLAALENELEILRTQIRGVQDGLHALQQHVYATHSTKCRD